MKKFFYRRTMVPRTLPDAFVVKPSGRLVWLQQLAHAILKRWGQHAMIDVESVKAVEIPRADNVLDSIRHEIDARINFNVLRREDLVVVVGLKEWREIDLLMLDHAKFYVGQGRGEEPGVFGVPLFVSGWFDGFVILPRKALMI